MGAKNRGLVKVRSQLQSSSKLVQFGEGSSDRDIELLLLACRIRGFVFRAEL